MRRRRRSEVSGQVLLVEAVSAEGWGTRLGFPKEGSPVAVVAEPFGV